jgi:hypothetical protein
LLCNGARFFYKGGGFGGELKKGLSIVDKPLMVHNTRQEIAKALTEEQARVISNN